MSTADKTVDLENVLPNNLYSPINFRHLMVPGYLNKNSIISVAKNIEINRSFLK